ncbi:MAG: hypothetical protein AAFN10_06015 [Bacteroidota bacterium]
MKYPPFFIITLSMLLGSISLQAQESVRAHSFGERLSLNLGFANHSVGFPLQNQLKAFNPSISNLGIAARLNRSQQHQLLLSVQSSFLANEVIGNSFLLGLAISYRYTHPTGFYTQLGLELGTLSQQSVREAYSYPILNIDPQPEKLSMTSSYSGLGWQLGYRLSKTGWSRFSVFLSQRFLIQSPYFSISAFDILPQNLLAIGFSYQLGSQN